LERVKRVFDVSKSVGGYNRTAVEASYESNSVSGNCHGVEFDVLFAFLKLHPSMNIFKKWVPFTVFQSIVHGTYPGNRTSCITFASSLFLARRENAWAFHILAANCLWWCVKYLQTYPIPLRSILPSLKG
jgi:hypothetical protein